jgi:hypothetical protein
MTPEQFCYWLQGRCELQPQNIPSEKEWPVIVAHLQTVFVKQTPRVHSSLGSGHAGIGSKVPRGIESALVDTRPFGSGPIATC